LRVKDIVEEIKTNIKTFEELQEELKQRHDRLKKELAEILASAKRMRILERVCVKIGRSCSIEACYEGVRVSGGGIVLDEGVPKLYHIEGCNVAIEDPDTADMYEALLRLKELTSQAVKQLSELLESL